MEEKQGRPCANPGRVEHDHDWDRDLRFLKSKRFRVCCEIPVNNSTTGHVDP
jgi:hypothetical protein